ncbi:DNA recombination protein RmuC [Agrobacterium larrymoorei]|uniref:Uncharacterized protein n=1 Tax=Agrobacterium larrymoorei TaxID=160699 RepID=A0AAF0HDJ5_9HYPH|nr:DNA recombination protein RmuC [Agrobacterium larrymoorei]WHA42381.1 hypothetical protein CFBP5477_007090 [Agrobacterium larrymoorei]
MNVSLETLRHPKQYLNEDLRDFEARIASCMKLRSKERAELSAQQKNRFGKPKRFEC